MSCREPGKFQLSEHLVNIGIGHSFYGFRVALAGASRDEQRLPERRYGPRAFGLRFSRLGRRPFKFFGKVVVDQGNELIFHERLGNEINGAQ